jgi:patatin-like phospholipase/acyl hydrolase
MTTVTVLAIDGGGIRGMIPAAFLTQLEQQTVIPFRSCSIMSRAPRPVESWRWDSD